MRVSVIGARGFAGSNLVRIFGDAQPARLRAEMEDATCRTT